ncbi:MAG: DNA topoisomerase IV subunit B [Bacteroidota bacterium]|nr:DNA topoisomerase IV subunit B [Bacteroidota bacterium]MDP3143975.1 DNA topoisomerase IV subunit B [Bacteroidota bacterium]MDP3557526.1 DNA topoisomerase IV subunit B [Bacteroidota bacterium]
MAKSNYTEDNIKSLDWKEHIRTRPGMYIGKLGDGSAFDDGIYVLLKEVMDNSIDEFMMGEGNKIDITVKEGVVSIRDYGRGIPLGKVVEVVSKMNTGGKYDSEAFKKSIGLNGVGTKAVNALSINFRVTSFRDGQAKTADFSKGELVKDHKLVSSNEKNGTLVEFRPDDTIFKKYHFIHEYIDRMIWNYAFLNTGLKLYLNGQEYKSDNGLKDLLEKNITGEIIYPIIHLKAEDIELAMTHSNEHYSEEYYSYVNGQYTTQGGTHQAAFREALVKTIREFYKKEFDPSDIRKSIVAAISIKVSEPIFESQTKTKLGSSEIAPGGQSMRSFVNDFMKQHLDNYLHKNPETAKAIEAKIVANERERKELSGIQKLARERAKKSSLHNKKLRDCRIHLDDTKDPRRLETSIFICEGDSASGSITKTRDVNTQAVFSLKGKPLNCFGLGKKIVYENEEFNLLQAALNIEDNLEELRYNNVIIATDADVDGMHIRLLLLTFFLQFFPDLVKTNHVKILQTPLFRVRNKKETAYCYSEEEKKAAVAKLGPKPEITRFKGLGEISPDEFKHFIGKDIRLEPVLLDQKASITELLNYYMGKNTQGRQDFIIENLRVEKATEKELIG